MHHRCVESTEDHSRAHNTAEYLAEFRSDIESFVPIEVVENCVGDYVEQSRLVNYHYKAFTDPSGGSSDSFTLAIAYRDREKRVVIDAVRERRPPVSPEDVITEFAALLKSYRISQVTGDRYAGEFPRELFRKQGIRYEQWSTKALSSIFGRV